jgi:uncharacterized protein (TIGR02145 family)
MSQQVTITSVTANTPVEIFYCDSFSANCVYVATVSVFPYTFEVPPPYNEQDYVIQIIDTQGCDIGREVLITPTPTSSVTPTPTMTSTVTPTTSVTPTMTPTSTVTSTSTPTPTSTITATPSPTPVVSLHNIGQNVFLTSGDTCQDTMTFNNYYTYISEADYTPVVGVVVYETLFNGVLYNPFNGSDRYIKMNFGGSLYVVQINSNGVILDYEVCVDFITPTRTPTPTQTPTTTTTPTTTQTSTPTPTQTPTNSLTPTMTPTQTPTQTTTQTSTTTQTPTSTPTNTVSSTNGASSTPTPTNTETPTPTPTQTPTSQTNVLNNPVVIENDEYISVGDNLYLMFVDPTPSSTTTPTPTPTLTPTETPTETPTNTPTNTETPTNTPTTTQTPTNTSTPTPTPTSAPSGVSEYGYLYSSYFAHDNDNFAPTGWRVPEYHTSGGVQSDYFILKSYVSDNGGSLKSTRTAPTISPRWLSPNTGASDLFGYTALPAGIRFSNGNFTRREQEFHMLFGGYDSTGNFPIMGDLILQYNNTNITSGPSSFFENSGWSVRFIKEDPNDWSPGDTVTDYEGNVYNTVKIGTQVWTVENWKSRKYFDGTDIPLIQNSSVWSSTNTPSMCYYV